MTRNQIEYWNTQETRRANKARERETNRSNLAREAETNRNNRAVEEETHRANVAREVETNRANVAREQLQRLESDRSYTISTLNLEETKRRNQVVEKQSQQTIDNNLRHDLATEQLQQAGLALNRAQLQETILSHRNSEAISKFNAREDARSHQAQEDERYRHDLATENIDRFRSATQAQSTLGTQMHYSAQDAISLMQTEESVRSHKVNEKQHMFDTIVSTLAKVSQGQADKARTALSLLGGR